MIKTTDGAFSRDSCVHCELDVVNDFERKASIYKDEIRRGSGAETNNDARKANVEGALLD